MTRGRYYGMAMLAVSLFLLAACGSSTETPAATPTPTPTATPTPTPTPLPVATPAAILALWESSGHADREAGAFNHWNDDGAVSTSCARCHSTPGFRDYLGDDGTAFGSVENPAPLGTTVECDACHNDAALALTEVTFPSGVMLTGLGAEARCMTCHQGRESTVSMNDHINAAGLATEDTPAGTALRFRNVHYFAAGATLYGGTAKGAYQYTLAGPDMIIGNEDDLPQYGFYDRRNPHVESFNTCIECHNPHSLERNIVGGCDKCHQGVAVDEDLKNIRMRGSVRDYDGDGNATEGVYYEILGLRNALLAAMKQYASAMANPIGYDDHRYPYFYGDTNNNNVWDDGEAGYTNWTARLLRAAYNYQYAAKDPGAFAHNPKYTIEFLYDSLANLNEHGSVTVPNFAQMWRNDSGHFDAGAEAFRHWDEDDDPDGVIMGGAVSSNCVRCHSPDGFDFWAEYGLDLPKAAAVGDGFRCEQCHVEGADFKGDPLRKFIAKVQFVSGVEVTNTSTPGPTQDDTFLCISCHRGREGGPTVEADIQARLNDGNPSTHPRFRNVHYLPAGATLWGDDGKMGYQYPAKTYKGKWLHAGEPPLNLSPETAQCAFCHLKDHTFLPQSSPTCVICHGSGPLENFRVNRPTDYDGDGNNTEKVKDEVQTYADRLLATLVDYALAVRGGYLTYDPDRYPYFTLAATPGGNNSAALWDEHIVRAAHNYQFWAKEPGAWAHNTHYILQLLYDSIDAVQTVGGLGTNRLTTPTTLTRP